MSKPITEKKYNEIHNFIRKNIGEKPAAGFDAAYKQGKAIEWITKFWPKLETYEAWTLKYSNVNDLTKSKESQLKDIYNKNPDFSAISEARMKTILAGNDVTKKELKDYYDFRNAQKAQVDEFNKKRYAEVSDEYTKANRAKEGGYFNSPLANEYAREQYLKGNKIAAYINEGLGKAAAATDFAPFPFSLAAPAIRLGQNIYSDQPVNKLSTAADFAGSFIPDIAEKPAKMGWQYLKQGKFGKLFDSKRAKQIENRINKSDNQVAEQAAKDIDLTANVNLDDLTNDQVIELYRNVKTPEIKKAIGDYWNARGSREYAKSYDEMATELANSAETMGKDARTKTLLEADIAKAIADKEAAKASMTGTERQFDYIKEYKKPELQVRSGNLPKEEPLMVNGDFNTYYKDVPLKDINEYIETQVEPSKLNDALYQIIKLGGTKAARSGIGGRLGQWDKFETEPKDNIESNINEVIKMYGNSWNLINKPEGYDSDPLIRAAYDKWKASLPKYEYKSWRE